MDRPPVLKAGSSSKPKESANAADRPMSSTVPGSFMTVSVFKKYHKRSQRVEKARVIERSLAPLLTPQGSLSLA